MKAFLGRNFKIKGIKNPSLAARIISLGIYPGRCIQVLSQSPWGGAVYVSIDSCHFALREDEFEQLELEELILSPHHV